MRLQSDAPEKVTQNKFEKACRRLSLFGKNSPTCDKQRNHKWLPWQKQVSDERKFIINIAPCASFDDNNGPTPCDSSASSFSSDQSLEIKYPFVVHHRSSSMDHSKCFIESDTIALPRRSSVNFPPLQTRPKSDSSELAEIEDSLEIRETYLELFSSDSSLPDVESLLIFDEEQDIRLILWKLVKDEKSNEGKNRKIR